MSTLTFSALSEVIIEMHNHTLSTHFGIEPTEKTISFMNSITTSSLTIGNAISLLFVIPIADTKGRKFASLYLRFILLLATSICQILAALFQASELFIMGQFLLGIHFPLRTFVTLVFIMECAPDKFRGFSCTVLIFAFVLAKLIMFSAASPTFLGTAGTWFIFPVVVLASSVIVFILSRRLPESPKWLVQQNKMTDAKSSIQFYHGENCSLNDILTNFVKEKNLTDERKLTMKQVLENDTMREALKILFSVLLFLEFDTGYVQSVYTIQFHKDAGFTVQEAMNINVILTSVLFPTKFVGPFILDTLGRRPTLLIAGIMKYFKSWLLLITQCIAYFIGPSVLTKVLYIGVEVFIILIPATGVNALLVLFVSELFPPSARTTVAQVMLLVNLGISFPIVSLFPIINTIFPPIFFAPFVITQLIFGIYLFRNMPETKGRAICDIIESMDEAVGSRTASVLEEKTPLMRDRAITLATRRHSILNTSRNRASTFDHNLIIHN